MIKALQNGINIYPIELLPVFKEAGHLANSILLEALTLCKPGISTIEIDEFIEKTILKHKAIPLFKGFENYPFSSCISVNEYIVHGLPSKETILKDGDLVTVDLGVRYKGLCSDNARTTVVGIPNEYNEIVKVAEEAYEEGLKNAIIGKRVGDIGNAIITKVLSYKFNNKSKYTVFYKFEGHGIGLNLHEAPNIPSIGLKNTGDYLLEGMCICIEPVITHSSSEVISYKDNKFNILQFKTKDLLPTAHHENQIYLTKEGPILLTL